ncbi:MAG: outer membrane lipoprotein-sorting protein [Deltaproteobacteria bacterium]|nr:outer membrane lipoprotein-sorting protein [Deltaproteobacteria bacterium]
MLIALPPWVKADDPEARKIMEKVDARDDGDNQVSDMVMILIDKNGNKRIRKIKSFGKDKGDDTLRLMFFLEPADVKDTAFLTYDYDDADRDDDQWLYLPALRKTKRIATSDRSGSFMGSDFSYADMTKRELDNYDYKLLKEGKVGDAAVWLIQSVPRSKRVIDQYGYTKSVSFVRKDNFVVIRAVNWVKVGKRLKYMNVKKLELIDGIWVPTEIHMTTKKAKRTLHKSIFQFNNVKFNQGLKEDYFSVRQMEKGL